MRPKPLRRSSWRHSLFHWHKMRTRGASRAATSPAIGLDFRVWLLAVGRAGASGHCVFDAGELVELIPKVVRTTGEIATYSDRAMRDAIRALVEAGLAAEGSTTRCIVLPTDVVDVAAARPGKPAPPRVLCPEHRHVDIWFGGGWISVDRSGRVAA